MYLRIFIPHSSTPSLTFATLLRHSHLCQPLVTVVLRSALCLQILTRNSEPIRAKLGISRLGKQQALRVALSGCNRRARGRARRGNGSGNEHQTVLMAVGAVPSGDPVPITAFDGVNQCCLGGQLLLEGGPDKFHPLLASESLGAITAVPTENIDIVHSTTSQPSRARR
jgi:hypothetical protein